MGGKPGMAFREGLSVKAPNAIPCNILWKGAAAAGEAVVGVEHEIGVDVGGHVVGGIPIGIE